MFNVFTARLFPDGDQLQDLHRQLEHPDCGLAQNVSAELGFLEPRLASGFLTACVHLSVHLRVCYDRAPRHRLALTFILSALWHGVFPGYYFTFLTAIPITMAARAVSAR